MRFWETLCDVLGNRDFHHRLLRIRDEAVGVDARLSALRVFDIPVWMKERERRLSAG